MRWLHAAPAQRLELAPGSAGQVGALVRDLGARRAMLVTTPGRLASEAGDRVGRSLGRALASTFDGARPHVPAPVVQAAVQQARLDGIDALVTLGGGACTDLAKAIAFFLEQQAGTPGTAWADRPATPMVAVPTTFVGAELTTSFAMTDPSTRHAATAASPTLAAAAVLYDPDLSADLPPDVAAGTGIDALAHAIEAACSPLRSAESEAVALAAVTALSAALPRMLDDPVDDEARAAVTSAAALAGRARQQAGGGLHHGLTRLLGGRTGAPHGVLSAVLLPHTLRYAAPAMEDDLRRVGDAIGDPDDPVGAVARLVERVGLPTALSTCGVTADDVAAVARRAEGDPDVRGNPVPVREGDAAEVLLAAL
jgi:maleylacetate reductase